MLTFHLRKTLISTQESEWEELVATSLGADVHPKRARGFCLAREALRDCFKEFKIDLNVKDISLEGYSQVRGFPTLRISLSHTSEWGAALVGYSAQYASLGIDIEPLERVVKPMILARVSHAEDLDMSPINLWALKEASFKALMNTGKFKAPLEFSSIRISEGKWDHSPSGLNGEWKIDSQEGLIVAMAWIRT